MENTFVENKKKSIGVLGAFALSVGTSIGWGFLFQLNTMKNKCLFLLKWW